MSVSCPFEPRPLTAEEFQELDYRVMGHAFASQNELGRLCEEDAYQRDLQARLLADGFRAVFIEVPVTVSHADFTKVYYLDLVADNAIYELKTAAALCSQHQAQLLNYLFLLGVGEAESEQVSVLHPKADDDLLAQEWRQVFADLVPSYDLLGIVSAKL